MAFNVKMMVMKRWLCTYVQVSMDVKHCAVKLSVHPCRGLVDEKFVVVVQNVPPGIQLTVHAFHRCEDGHGWEAFAHYVSDASGSVNVSRDASLGGTYSGVEQMGLLWSLRPVPGSKPGLRMRKMNVQTPMEFTISVHQGFRSEGFLDQVPLASQVVERWYMAPGVRRIPITQDDLSATLFLPSGPGPFPAILDLWGGSGQLVEYRAALLASHGFASLALDYLTPKITQETGKMVDDSYFEKAFGFLQQYPQVLTGRIAMLGLSFGCSVTLRIAAYSLVVKPTCAVCISGSHVQPIGAKQEDIFAFYDQYSDKIQVNEKNQAVMKMMLLPITSDPTLKVDVGRVQCPLLLVVGEDDQNWPVLESAQDMKEMMERAGNSHLLTILSYPDAGHLIEPPYAPHTQVSSFRSIGTRHKVTALWGGRSVAHAYAQEDSWKKMLAFFRHNLYAAP
ncbi:peroxisomal succinyl-coenzyme A thioesterase-like isoform X2 [Dunckerocampus dactyliophorus]|uniref:peroxisomal succinyl-coenzyme A thioesterase-like isoform X2 n=1 Tax=Dunckerocampus dactyliophorus TaxID=161453 RepID=UPI002404A5C1|nr:peroxisomal succinyl-coenzyme A thioesterase-like isoform X2 [Dunckerocampus dactyliophorus]